MIEFFKNNLGTIIVFFVLALIVALIIVKIIKDKKQGKSSCGCACDQCENSKYCSRNYK